MPKTTLPRFQLYWLSRPVEKKLPEVHKSIVPPVPKRTIPVTDQLEKIGTLIPVPIEAAIEEAPPFLR